MTGFFYNLLIFFTWLTPGHYVWVAIVIITIILRLIFLKPTINMTKMQQKQKELQPHLETIKTTHKDDKQAEQKATLELYKQHGVNPLSGCLPMIVQIVVLIFFYRVFISIGIEHLKPEFLYSFVPRPESIRSSFIGYDLSQTVHNLFKLGGAKGYLALLFPLIAGGTQLIQSLQMRAMQPKPAANSKSGTDAFQKALSGQMTFLFPIMTAYISYTLTAALSIYWITQTILMIAQQYYVMKKFPIKPSDQLVPKSECADVVKEQKTSKHGVDVVVRERKKD
jgi:YidC/Oxa1 family membrane protein insertase